MSFEPLSHHNKLIITDFPKRWLPLIHLYDPDLPLFLTYYFHVLPEDLPPEKAPSYENRAYGFLEEIWSSNSAIEISVLCNKDLEKQENFSLRKSVELEVRGRLGISDPVFFDDVSSAFQRPLEYVNSFLSELWNRVVPESFGKSLPFGHFYDEVFGLVRMVSTWFPPSGRKSELIQTHYFLSKFGERINISVEAPKPRYHQRMQGKTVQVYFPKVR